MKKYLGYALACITAALVVSFASAGGFEPFIEPPDESFVSEMVPMPAGKKVELPGMTLKLVRVGVSHNEEGDAIVYGVTMAEFESAKKLFEPTATLVVKRRNYFCTTKTILTNSTTVYDQKENVMSEPKSKIIPDSAVEIEFNFMCQDVVRGACTTKKCT